MNFGQQSLLQQQQQQQSSLDSAISGIGAMQLGAGGASGSSGIVQQQQYNMSLLSGSAASGPASVGGSSFGQAFPSGSVLGSGSSLSSSSPSLPPLPGPSGSGLVSSQASVGSTAASGGLLRSPQLSSLAQATQAARGAASSGMPPLPPPAEGPVESKTGDGDGTAGARDGADASAATAEGTHVTRSKISEIERMAQVNSDVLSMTLPAEAVRDQIHFIVNNIAKSNFDSKMKEMKDLIKPDHFNWFANYLVVKRISTQPNLHPLYLSILDVLNAPALMHLVLGSAYHNVTKLLQSPNITTSSSERSLLRNLGVWLGQVTLALNRPLLQRRIDLKELLFWGFETGRLIAVCSFVAKIMEGVKDSKVFRPPNPWLMAILGLMRELYEIEDLKLNIKFEVQVLCKNINVKIEDIPKSNLLVRCRKPLKDSRNPDFNFKASAAAAVAAATAAATVTGAAQQPMAQRSPQGAAMMSPGSGLKAGPADMTGSGSAGLGLGGGIAASAAAVVAGNPASSVTSTEQLQAVLANLLHAVTISPSLQYFATNPNQRRVVAAAVERGIREIIQSAVDRSVSIALATTKQLALKDFATEGNEQTLRGGAVLMITSLTGSLAQATCKEPLRISIGNHLRTLLAPAVADQTTIEQIVQVCSTDNVEIGAALIEKVAVEKAVREVEAALADGVQARRKAREAGQQFSDDAFLKVPEGTKSKFPTELSDMLKPRAGGLSQQQLQVYEAFSKVKYGPAGAATASGSGVTGSSPGSAGPSPGMRGQQGLGVDMKALPPASGTSSVAAGGAGTLTMTQALEAYQATYLRIDNSLRNLMAQLQGREVNMSMLGGDHEIVLCLRDLITITQRAQAAVRGETAMTFSEVIFNRMFESVRQPDSLRLEVFVAILEAVRDACGGSRVFSPDFISWLGKYAVLVSNDETGRKVYRLILILLVRAKLLRCPDLDVYFVMYIDGGRNLFWLELALSFIRQCLVEGMGTIYDFGNTFEAVNALPARTQNAVLKKQLQKWLTDIKALTAAQEEQKAAAAAVGGGGSPATAGVAGAAGAAGAVTNTGAGAGKDMVMREHVTLLLDRWLRVWTQVTDPIFHEFVQLMHNYGVLKTEEAADRFFRLSTDICVEACLRHQQAPAVDSTAAGADGAEEAAVLNYTVMDAFSKLLLLLIRVADKDTPFAERTLLSRVLTAVGRAVLDDHEARKAAGKPFDQRPYYRLFSNLSHEMGVPDAKQEPSPTVLPMLSAFTHVYLALQPAIVPGFAYAWVQLISRRTYLPHMLLAKGNKGLAFPTPPATRTVPIPTALP